MRPARYQAGQEEHAATGDSRRNIGHCADPHFRLRGRSMTGKSTIEIDPELSDLIPGFLARKRTDLQTILESVRNGDFESIGRIAHRLKGEGGSFGIEAITEAGRDIEGAARAREPDAITSIARELLPYLDSVHIVYAPPAR